MNMLIFLIKRSMSIISVMLIAIAASQALANDADLPGPKPTYSNLSYADTGKNDESGHLLDLYLPKKSTNSQVPLVIFTHGSGWMMTNGRDGAQALAEKLIPHGYAVAGVAIRSSSQAHFPAQLYDIKAAIRWLKAHANEYGYSANHIGIMGESSGGWTSAIAATTGDEPSLEGSLGVQGYSSAVNAAIAFYPPTDFSEMDAFAARPCDPTIKPFGDKFCHNTEGSPESNFLGCTLSDPQCAVKSELANPINYISKADPAIMVIHGQNDRLVAYNQGEKLYQALNKSCHDSQFITLPVADHGMWYEIFKDKNMSYGSTIRATKSEGCETIMAKPVTMSWDIITQFFDEYLK
ncbi:alpha/beta hydrolase fold domain-containing protein [Vibrio natriegens]|uniref:alpha/beta hydrolase fold domain-containing protein n=1 Tax=Vibrio natriegens TaxID=691 RepID=UPI0035571673